MPSPPERSHGGRRRLIIAGLVIVGVSALALGVARPWRKDFPVITVTRQTLRDTIEISGTVEAAQAVTIKAATTGAVRALAVAEDHPVADGAALLTLDQALAKLQLDQARANSISSLAQATTQLQTALASAGEVARRQGVSLANARHRLAMAQSAVAFRRADLARNETLLADGALSAQNLEAQRQQFAQSRLELEVARDELARIKSGAEGVAAANSLKQARTGLATAQRQGQAAVALAKKALDDTTVVAPFAGTVTQWLVDPGAWVTAGTSLAQFQDLAHLRLRLPADELDMPKLRQGGPVSLTFDAYPDEPMIGEIARISRASVLGVGNVQVFPVEVTFRDPQGRVRPGMSGDARILVRELPNVLALPMGAVKRDLDRYLVTVVKDGKATPREVTPGISTLDRVEVKAGLSEGEQVLYAAPSPAPKP